MDIPAGSCDSSPSERAAHNHDLLYFDLTQVTKASTQTTRSACLCHFHPAVNIERRIPTPDDVIWK
jgi:hypothetical protein